MRITQVLRPTQVEVKGQTAFSIWSKVVLTRAQAAYYWDTWGKSQAYPPAQCSIKDPYQVRPRPFWTSPLWRRGPPGQPTPQWPPTTTMLRNWNVSWRSIVTCRTSYAK